MSTTITLNKERRLVEQRLINKRKIEAERVTSTQRMESSLSMISKYNHAIDLLGAVLAAGAGILVLFFSGLLSGASSPVVQIVLISVIVFTYMIAFRTAYYS